MNHVAEALSAFKDHGVYRSLQSTSSLIDFSSNDYLGLSACQKIRANLIRELQANCPLGATGSRLLSGQTEYHERVECFLAQEFRVSSALLFSSGFMANLGVLSAFSSIGAHFFSDELNHASLVDGLRIAKSPKTIFRHNDMNHLEEMLKGNDSPLKVIVTESVFSMGGDLAPLPEITELARRFDAWLVVDEAHATGVFGSRGLGRLEEHGSQLVAIHTAGKALGGQGAFVLSGHEFRELIINRARSFIFSTALSPLSALQIEFSLKGIVAQPQPGRALLLTAEKWRQRISGDFNTLQSKSQIIPIILGSNEEALRISRHLQNVGFDVRAIRSPTVMIGTERLRITLKSFHQADDLQNLYRALREAPI